jgi:hypothetical protein
MKIKKEFAQKGIVYPTKTGEKMAISMNLRRKYREKYLRHLGVSRSCDSNSLSISTLSLSVAVSSVSTKLSLSPKSGSVE